MQKLFFLIFNFISHGSTNNKNSSSGRKIRSHGGEGESDYNPYDSPMFQFIQDLTEEEISDLAEETLWDISQFYKNNPSLEPPSWFTSTTTGSITTTTHADTTTPLSFIPVTFPIMQMAMDNTPPWLNPDFTTTPITTTSIQSSTSAFIMSSYRDPEGRDNRASRREAKLSRHPPGSGNVHYLNTFYAVCWLAEKLSQLRFVILLRAKNSYRNQMFFHFL